MKLAFHNEGHYTDFSESYELYKKRAVYGEELSERQFRKAIREYCKLQAERIRAVGIVDLPRDLGSVAAAILVRRPQYRGKKFIGYGKKDWSTGYYDGKMKTFGMVFLPKRHKKENLRSFGFVANRNLFKETKSFFESDDCWKPLEFNDEMI